MSAFKFISETLPIACFFITYKLYDLFYATLALILISVALLIINYVKYKKIPKMQLFSTLILILFGSLTLITNNLDFIKIKLTIVNLIFAAILLIGVYFKKPFLQYILGNSIKLSERNWLKLSIRWSIFFIIIAIINEIVWRNFPDKVWVNFKVFGVIPLTLMFIVSQMPFIHKHTLNH